MAPGQVWQNIPMISSFDLPILKQNPHGFSLAGSLMVGFQAYVVDSPRPPRLFEKVGKNSFNAFHSLVKSLLKLAASKKRKTQAPTALSRYFSTFKIH